MFYIISILQSLQSEIPLMSKKQRSPSNPTPTINNLVAKHAGKFNRAATFRDATAYRRKPKHAGREPSPITLQAA